MKLLIYRSREDERLSWPCWLTYSGRFTHINGYPSAASPLQTSESSPVRDRRSTTEPPNQPTNQPSNHCVMSYTPFMQCLLSYGAVALGLLVYFISVHRCWPVRSCSSQLTATWSNGPTSDKMIKYIKRPGATARHHHHHHHHHHNVLAMALLNRSSAAPYKVCS